MSPVGPEGSARPGAVSSSSVPGAGVPDGFGGCDMALRFEVIGSVSILRYQKGAPVARIASRKRPRSRRQKDGNGKGRDDMHTRPLGQTGLRVTPLGLGLAALGRPGYIN